MDEIRQVITPTPRYTEEERQIVYAALAYMAKLLTDEGVNVIIDATGNLRQYRDIARNLIPDFAEVYIKCPMDLSIEREAHRKTGFAPQEIYEKGMTGRSQTVPGLNVPYEEPQDPIVIIDTVRTPPEGTGKQAADALINKYGGTHG